MSTKQEKEYNGHPSYEHWNATLVLTNTETLYGIARSARSGAELLGGS